MLCHQITQLKMHTHTHASYEEECEETKFDLLKMFAATMPCRGKNKLLII